KAIRLLAEQHLIKQDYRVDSSKNHVFIPLSRKLSKTEITQLSNQLEAAEQVEHLFFLRQRRAGTLKDSLHERIPQKLLASLPSSYDIIGDIAVLDLPPQMSTYENIVANGIREVNKNVSVILAKTGSIQGKERILPTRHVAGENRTVTVHRESGCVFKVDLSKAYFSPRLSHEHERIAGLVEEGEIVTDLFAGIGPF